MPSKEQNDERSVATKMIRELMFGAKIMFCLGLEEKPISIHQTAIPPLLTKY
jgi:hypothetical protein